MPADKKDNLFDLIANPSFEKAIGKDLTKKLHYCRKAGNQAIHNEKEFTLKEAVLCLQNLFEFVQWIDKHYGKSKDFSPRLFTSAEIPAKDGTLKKILKNLGWVAFGFIGALAALFFADDKKKF